MAKTATKTKSIYGVHPGVLMTQKWIIELKQKTGRSLDEWLKFIRKEGPPTEQAAFAAGIPFYHNPFGRDLLTTSWQALLATPALLESALRGRRSIGLDLNPVACLVARVKVTPVDSEQLDRFAARLTAAVRSLAGASAPTLPGLGQRVRRDAGQVA